jgi:hypothetical protein
MYVKSDMADMLQRVSHHILTGKNMLCVTVHLYILLIHVVAVCIPSETPFVRFCNLSYYSVKFVIDQLLNGWSFIS